MKPVAILGNTPIYLGDTITLIGFCTGKVIDKYIDDESLTVLEENGVEFYATLNSDKTFKYPSDWIKHETT